MTYEARPQELYLCFILRYIEADLDVAAGLLDIIAFSEQILHS